jgi:Na+/proline symporter
VSGAFAAPYIYGLYWKRVTKAGAYAGLLSGLSLEIILFFALGPANAPLSASFAIIAPFIVTPLVSLFTAPPERRCWTGRMRISKTNQQYLTDITDKKGKKLKFNSYN